MRTPRLQSPKRRRSPRSENRSRSPCGSQALCSSRPSSPSPRHRSRSRQRRITRHILNSPLSPVSHTRPMLLTFHAEDSTADRHQAIRSSSFTKRNPRPQLRRASIHQGLQPSTPVQSRRKVSRRPTLKQFLTAVEDARWGSGVNANDTEVFSSKAQSMNLSRVYDGLKHP